MGFLSSIGDLFSNEVSHIGDLFGQMGKNPGKTLEQFMLGAADPLGASIWGSVLGQDFTPLVNQFGGETQAQYAQSALQGVNVGPSEAMGGIADTIAGIWGGSEAGGALSGWLGGMGAGAEAGAATTASGFGGVGTDAAVGGFGDAASTASGFGGVGMDPSVASFAEAGGPSTTSGFGGVGMDPSVAGPGGAAGGGAPGGAGSRLAALLHSMSSNPKATLGIGQLFSSLYGLNRSNQLQRQARAPNPAQLTSMPGYQAGLDAVQRSMASQGYQGSGNMMAALQKYGGDAYSQMWQNNMRGAEVGMSGLQGAMGSLGLLTSGMSNLAGWYHG